MARSAGTRPGAPHQRVGVEPVEQLHHVVERAVVGDAEVEEVHGVRRAEARDHLRLALEPALRVLGDAGAPSPVERGPNQLDGGGARQQPVLGAPHFAHAALPEPLHQPVAAQLARAADLGAERVDDAGADVGHDHDEQVGEHEPEEELQRIRAERRGARRHRDADRRPAPQLTEASAATTARRGGVGTTTVNSSVHTATHESPSQRMFMSSARRIEELGRGDAVAADHLEGQPDVHRDAAVERDRSRITAATSSATAIEITPGPHSMKLPKRQRPILRKQERREEPGHEEHEGVEQGQDAQPRRRTG